MQGGGVLRSATIAWAAVWLSCALARPAAGQAPAPVGTLHTIELPGGVEGLRRAIGDRRTMTPASVVLQVTRRFHGGSAGATSDDPRLIRLRAWLRACEKAPACGAPGLTPDRIPLPGPPAFWKDVVFDGKVAEAKLAVAILGRRDAALLYTALFSMREEVRAWILARPALVRRLLGPEAAALVVAAPYLRLENDRWVLPGAPEAVPVWTAVASVSPDDTEAWLPALLQAHGGIAAYLLEVVATLPPAQQRAMLALGGDEPSRVNAASELLAGLQTASRGWQVSDRPFWRPSPEPAFLLTQLPISSEGRIALPGGRAFWTLVFEAGERGAAPDAVTAAWRDRDTGPVTAGWLVEKIWIAPAAEQSLRYERVLFAARWLAAADGADPATIATVLRGYARYPQLLRVLDRMEAGDPARLAALVRRADTLAQGGEGWRGRAAVVRWQAVLAALDYMVRLGALEPADLATALDALAEPGPPDSSRGARVRALLAGLGIDRLAGDVQARTVEDALLARLTRSGIGAGRQVTWEQVPYRVDIGAGERDRIARVRGRDAWPRLDAAWRAFALADADPSATERTRAALDALVAAVRLDRVAAADDDLGREARLAVATARRLLAAPVVAANAPRLRAAFEDLGEALATEGLAEIAYALQLGWAEDLPLSAVAAFRRHGYTTASPTGAIDASWFSPVVVQGRGAPWHLAGSLLGLEDALGLVALRRATLRPLGAAPSLDTGDRRWFVSTAATLDRRRYTDDAQDRLVMLVTRGQSRLRSIRDAAGARTAADAAGLSPLRASLAGWLAEVNPNALAGVFGMTDLVRLGADGAALPPGLVTWGNVDRPITGRLGAGSLPSLPWERYAGRSTRLLSCALPDLQLWLAFRLAELDLPALLVPDLMPAATFELVHTAAPRHVDDFDALAEHARRLDRTTVERYLGLVTTAGSLRRGAEAPAGAGTTTAPSDAGSSSSGGMTIREPAEGAPVVGTSRVSVALPPGSADPTDVTVLVDGRELCRLEKAPWACAWEAGVEAKEHHLRVIATFADGNRLVANRRTRGLDVDERVEVSAVQVPVIVTDAKGRFVTGLTKDSFTLLENGKPQRLDTLIDDSLPLQLIAAVDISASMEQAMPKVQAAVKRFLGQLRPGDTTTLLGFNETVFVLAESEGDAALRDAAVEALVPWGGTAFFDATVKSLDLVGQRAGRRGVIVFSDGDDRHSVGGRAESLRRIEEGQVAVYTVGFGDGASAQFRTTLQAFAEASGGRAFFPRAADDLAAAFGAIFDELSHQYILSYVSTAPADGSWRTLEIRACDGCRVRAREGYRAPER